MPVLQYKQYKLHAEFLKLDKRAFFEDEIAELMPKL